MKVPFETAYIPKIEKGEIKVETKSGLPVKILCWDAKSAGREDDIIALVTCSDGTTQNVQRYYSNGHLIADSSHRGDKDLYVILQDTPLKPLEDAMKEYAEKMMFREDKQEEDEITYKAAQNIMGIARNIVSYRLPKWHRATCDVDSDSLDYLVKFKHDGGDYKDWDSLQITNRLREGEWYLDISDDEFFNLPKDIIK